MNISQGISARAPETILCSFQGVRFVPVRLNLLELPTPLTPYLFSTLEEPFTASSLTVGA